LKKINTCSNSFKNTCINNIFNCNEKINIYNITDKSKSDYPEENITVKKTKSKFFNSSPRKFKNNENFNLSKELEIIFLDKINDNTTNKSKKTEKEKLSFSQNKRLITSNITSISNSYEKINLKNNEELDVIDNNNKSINNSTKEEYIGEIIVEKTIKNTCKESCRNNCIIF